MRGRSTFFGRAPTRINTASRLPTLQDGLFRSSIGIFFPSVITGAIEKVCPALYMYIRKKAPRTKSTFLFSSMPPGDERTAGPVDCAQMTDSMTGPQLHDSGEGEQLKS